KTVSICSGRKPVRSNSRAPMAGGGKPGSIRIFRSPARMSVVVACGVRVGCFSPQIRLRLSVPMLMMSARTTDEVAIGFRVAYGARMKRPTGQVLHTVVLPAIVGCGLLAALAPLLVGCASTDPAKAKGP